jgi:uncharacterized protein
MPMNVAGRVFLGVFSILACLATVQPQWAAAQQRPPASEEALTAAREFVGASGAGAQFDQVMPILMSQMSQAFIALAPQRAAEIREVMGEVIRRFTVRKQELIDKVAAIYAEQLSIEDLREMTKFYQSGAGRRFVLALPEITRRSAAAGHAWGQTIGEEIAAETRRELKKRGIDL